MGSRGRGSGTHSATWGRDGEGKVEGEGRGASGGDAGVLVGLSVRRRPSSEAWSDIDTDCAQCARTAMYYQAIIPVNGRTIRRG
jgi:hypothetical protein